MKDTTKFSFFFSLSSLTKGSTLLLVVWSFLFILTSCNSGNEESEDISFAIKEIAQMKHCRERAENKEFYLHQYRAHSILEKYEDDIASLNDKQQKQMVFAESEYAFQLTDYLLQIGNRQEALKVMHDLATNSTLNIHSDTTQYLNYLYHQGLVEFMPINLKKNKEGILRGYDCLMQCYILSMRRGYKLYQALSMQSLCHYFMIEGIMKMAKEFDPASIRYINEDGVPDSLLAGNLAERALDIFLKTNNSYYIADGWRQLAICYINIGDAQQALECLNMAAADPHLDSLPDLHASIAEQMSMTYAALNDKYNSDLYRNKYLDLQDSTRQDKQLEARAESLQFVTDKIWQLVWWSFGVFVLLCITTFILIRMRKKKMQKYSETSDEIEEMEEELAQLKLQYSNALRSAVEQRSKISIVSGMLPLIDRMKLSSEKHSEADMEYVSDLVGAIEKQNTMLTQWIKLHQGSVAPKIETLPLQEVFSVIKRNSSSFTKQGITLKVEPTDAKVKADRTLTLFLLNTLTDNARKATPQGGTVTLSCEKKESYADISITDTGKGMTEELLAHLFEYKPINDDGTAIEGTSHKFGLQNCRGIIDRYRKISSQFSCCSIFAESKQGKGTTIHFRLPLVMKILMAILSLFLMMQPSDSMAAHTPPAAKDAQVAKTITAYTDSLWYNNVRMNYAVAMLYADSANAIIKKDSTISSAIRLTVFNETAVASLALHKWEKYRYYNYRYTMLYKECTADTTLTTYCQTMERREMTANYAMLVVLVLIASLIPLFWFLYLKPVVKYRRSIRKRKAQLKEDTRRIRAEFDRVHLLNNIADNQLSTLKHETMFYPTRIQQQIAQHEDVTEIQSTVGYYRELYAMLSTKALSNTVSGLSFPVKAVSLPGYKAEDKPTVIVNEELMSYLLLLLKRHNQGKTPVPQIAEASKGYVRILYPMPFLRLTSQQLSTLFSSETIDVDFLIMRQILRETGEASLHYACGIKIEPDCPVTTISITLPTKN